MKEREQLIKDEGLRLYPYRCTAGKITIGVGRNLEDNPLTPDEIMSFLLARPHIKINNTNEKELRKQLLNDFYQAGITEKEAMYLLDNDIKSCLDSLQKRIRWFNSQPEEVQNILLNMCFQMGITGLMKFKNTLGMIERGEYGKAADNMALSLWAKQTPNRANRLIQRMRRV